MQSVIQKMISLVLTIAFARLLTKEDYGLYSQVFLVVGFTIALASSALPMGLSYFYGQYQRFSQRQLLFKRFFITFFIVSLLLGIIFIYSSSYFTDIFSNYWFLQYKYIIASLIIFSILNGFFGNFSLLTNNLRNFLIINVTVMTLMLMLQLSNIFTGKDIFNIFLIFTLSQLFIFILLSFKVRKYMRIKSKKKLISIDELKYILPISVVGLIGVINELIDQFMVSAMLNPIAMAELKIGSFQIPFVSVVTISAVTVLIPIFSKLINQNKKEEIIYLWNQTTQKTIVLLLPIFVFCLIFAHEIIGFLFSNKYEHASYIFQIYTMKYFLTVITFGTVMGSLGLQKQWMYNLFIIVAINIVLNYFAIKYYGIYGAATVTAIVWYIGASLQIYQINRKLRCSFWDYFPYKQYLKVLSSSLILTLIWFLMFRYLEFSSYMVVPVAIIYYITIVYLFDRKFEYIRKGIV